MIEREINININTTGVEESKTKIDSVTSSQKKLTKSTDEYSGVLNKVEGSLQGMLSKISVLGVNLGDVYGQLKGNITGFKDMGKGIKAAISGFNLASVATKKFALALLSTGVGAIAIALGTLVAAFLSTQKGIDSVNKVIQPLKAQFETLIGVVQDMSMHLGKLFSGDLKGFIKGVVGETKGLGDKMKEAAEKGERLAELTKEMSQASIELANVTAKANVQLEDANSILQDVTASAEDRAKAEISAKEAINLKYDAEEKLMALQIEELKIKQSLNDTSDEELLQLAQLEAAYTTLTAARTKELTTITKKGNAAAKQAESEAKAAIKAKQDELKAKAQLEAEYEQGRLEAQRAFEDFNNSLIEDDKARNLAIQETKRNRIIEDIEFETQLLQEKYAGDVEKLAQLEADKLTTIQNADIALKAYQDEVLAKENEAAILAEEKALSDLIAFEEKKRAILQGYKLQDLEGQALEEEEALIAEEAALAKLQEEREAGLLSEEEYNALKLNIEEDFQAEKDAISAKYAETEKQRKLKAAKEGLNTAQSYSDSLNNLAGNIFKVADKFGKQDEASKKKRLKRQFAVNKAFQLVNAGIGTALGVVTALSAPFPLNIIQATIAAATGAAQIATIAASKFDPEGGGDASAAAPTANVADSAATPATPDPTLFQANAPSETNIGESSSLTDSGQQTIRAVVVESDITDTQNRLDSIKSESEL